jgi:ABC-type nitrate/sulfonate/bicarbonate transport system substrate-binding protein
VAANTAGPGTSVRISYASPAVSNLPIYAALAQGFFRQQGLEVAYVQMVPAAAIAALSNGEIDFTDSPSNAIEGAVHGFPFRVVYSAWTTAPWTLMGKANIQSPQQLKGRVVGTNQPGSSPYLYLQAGLKGIGLTLDDVSVRSLGGTQNTYAALLAGQIDAGVLSPPFDAQAEEQGFREVLFLGRSLQLPYVGLGTTTAVIRERRPIVVGMVRALLDASHWLKSHPDEATDLVVQNVGTTPEIARRSVEKMLPLLSETGDAPLDGVQQAIDAQVEVTQQQTSLKAVDAVDFGPLEEARAQH